MSNMPTHLQQRINPIREIEMSMETVGALFEKFQTFSTMIDGLEVCEEP